MKIWREDITKDALKKGSVNMACIAIIFAILTGRFFTFREQQLLYVEYLQ